MRRHFRSICLLLITALFTEIIPQPARAADPAPLFEDSFAGGLANWDLFGSIAWQVAGSGTEAQLVGATTSTGPQRAVAKASVLPYTAEDYSLEFTAEADRFRALFRYTSGTSYYFLEFKNEKMVELWAFPNSSSSAIIGVPIDISAIIPGFNMADRHQYRIIVQGNEFKLIIDGVPVNAFTDSTLTAGGVGFSLKSLNASAAVHLTVDHVVVNPIIDSPPTTLAIVHSPTARIAYNADLPLSFSVTNANAATTATISYGYGTGELDRVLQAAATGSGAFLATIPGTTQSDRIRYVITAQEDEGRLARYPESGESTVLIEGIAPYVNDFEADALNAPPADWTTGGNTRVIQLPDGNKVLNLNGSGSARLNLPQYQNVENFVAKFKVKYERTSTNLQNTWRLRYRATDDMNNNAMEWATHNSKYFIMRKTTLGGNYFIANYVKSLLDDWHDYELRVNGITHQLLIDGVEAAIGDDSDPLALKKGYFQWNVVGGINLSIDDFSIEPLEAAYVIDLQPSGNYAGIYSQGEIPGLTLALDAGASAHEFRMDYSVRRADGDQALVASGMKTYSLDPYAKSTDTVAFDPVLNEIGTYDVFAEFAVDGVIQTAKSKRMRLVMVKEASLVQSVDLDNESVFGLNTHYALNWKDDIIDGARKLGSRHHRSFISWEDVDKNVKDASDNPVYDYSKVDPKMDKLFSYGFNQITGLTIDRNANYQNGTVNSTAGLKANSKPGPATAGKPPCWNRGLRISMLGWRSLPGRLRTARWSPLPDT